MTKVVWYCIKCGYSKTMHIEEVVLKCPKCGAEYELVERIRGAHIFHSIPITKLKETGELNAPFPTVFASGPDKEALRKYFGLLSEIREKLKGLRKDGG